MSERLVFEAAREAHGKNYAHLFVLGFGLEPNARMLVEKCNDVMGIPATYVEATRDLMMGDLWSWNDWLPREIHVNDSETYFTGVTNVSVMSGPVASRPK